MTPFFAVLGILGMIGGTVALIVTRDIAALWAVGGGLVVFAVAVDHAANSPDRDWR